MSFLDFIVFSAIRDARRKRNVAQSKTGEDSCAYEDGYEDGIRDVIIAHECGLFDDDDDDIF